MPCHLIENQNKDYGNGYYDDHHFHYGYFLQAISLVAMHGEKLYDDNGWWKDIGSVNPSDKSSPLPDTKNFFTGVLAGIHGASAYSARAMARAKQATATLQTCTTQRASCETHLTIFSCSNGASFSCHPKCRQPKTIDTCPAMPRTTLFLRRTQWWA